MKEIKLTQNKVALVDDEDFEELNKYKWFAANPSKDIWYAKRTINKTKKSIRMHRVIMEAKHKEDFIDHKDRNGLNNQKSNLRRCSRGQNGANRSSSNNKSSKYLGVSWHRTCKKYIIKNGEEKISESWRWWASIKSKGKTLNLGGYKTEEDAALAYNKAALSLHGEFANLNMLIKNQ